MRNHISDIFLTGEYQLITKNWKEKCKIRTHEEKEANDPPVTPKPVASENEDNLFLKTTSKSLVLKPPSINKKPGKQTTKSQSQSKSRKRLLPETPPANQKRISSLYKPTPKLTNTTIVTNLSTVTNTTIVTNPSTVTNNDEIAQSVEQDGQSSCSLLERQKPCQKPEDTEWKLKSFNHQDTDTCPDLGENLK